MKTKVILLCLCLFAGYKASAYDAKIHGIYYDFVGDEAIVTYKYDDEDEAKKPAPTYNHEYDYSVGIGWNILADLIGNIFVSAFHNPKTNSKAYKGDVVIPKTVKYHRKTYRVTTIGEKAFYGCRKLTSVRIPESVTFIGHDAFYGCSNLTPVRIPESVTNDTLAISYQKPIELKVTEENFPDANFRDWILSQEFGSDSVLTKTDISGIRYVNIEKRSIQSLKGIEYFTRLKYLYCDDNLLTELDVSKNRELETLLCSANQLTELNVSKNCELETLLCSANLLTELDVSKNRKLETLWCSRNLLTELDVSQNTSLKELYCNHNQIKGEAMDAFVKSLPTVRNKKMYVIYHTGEQNVMTAAQVKAAKAKGWIPYYSDGSNWLKYTGSKEESE